MPPKMGQIVIYICEFDADTSTAPAPNVAPALVTKVNANGNPDLSVFFMNGVFMKSNVPQDDGSVKRGSWYFPS